MIIFAEEKSLYGCNHSK